MPKKPLLLMILDGWGINPNPHHNAVALAQTPNLTRLLAEYPHVEIRYLRHGGRAAGGADGQLRGRASQYRRRPGGLSGPDPYHQIHSGWRFFHQSDPAGVHCQDQGGRRQAAPLRPALGWRGAFPQHPSLRPAGTGQARRPDRGLCPLPAGWPRHAAPERQSNIWRNWRPRWRGSASAQSRR